MIEFISGWVKNIILIVLFAAFLELLLPNSSLQRFIRVIMGLLIMLAILNPVIDVVQGKWGEADIAALASGGSKQAAIIRTVNMAAEDRERLARDIYKRDLAKQVRALVIAIDGVADAYVTVELQNKTGGGYGAIHKLSLYVKPGNVSKTEIIPKVSIGSSAHPELELKDSVRNKIRKTITELYQLREYQVDIKSWN